MGYSNIDVSSIAMDQLIEYLKTGEYIAQCKAQGYSQRFGNKWRDTEPNWNWDKMDYRLIKNTMCECGHDRKSHINGTFCLDCKCKEFKCQEE
jgi:hypothetical protein